MYFRCGFFLGGGGAARSAPSTTGRSATSVTSRSAAWPLVLMALMTYPFLAAFVWLRISQPDVPRPFTVPGGLCGALFCTIPPFLVGTLYIYTCVFVEEDHTMGVPYFNVQCMVATIIIGLLFHLFYALCLRHCRDDPHSRSSLYDKL